MQQTAALKGMKECWPDRQPQVSEEGPNAADGEVSKAGGGGGVFPPRERVEVSSDLQTPVQKRETRLGSPLLLLQGQKR